jgi:hypothetical protein
VVSVHDRIAQLQKAAIPPRLLKGAKVLGHLWKSGNRCGNGWALHCSDPEGGEHEFCRAKDKWIGLLEDLGAQRLTDVDPKSPFGILEAMTVRELEATGLTVNVDVRGLGPCPFGPAGQPWENFEHLASDDQNWGTAQLMWKIFKEESRGIPG